MANPDYFLRGSDGPITSLTFFHPAETKDVYLLSGSVVGTVHVWYLKTRRIVNRLAAHSGSVLSIMRLNANTILTHGRDGAIHRWEVESVDKWTKICSWTCSSLGFCAATLLRNNSQESVAMPSATHEAAIDLAHISERKPPIVTLKPSNDRKAGMLMSLSSIKSKTEVIKHELISNLETGCECPTDSTAPDIDDAFLAGYEDGSIEVINLHELPIVTESQNDSQRPSLNFVNFHENPITSLDFCVATRRGVSGSADGKLAAWILDDCGTINRTRSVEASSCAKPGIGCVRIRPDGKLVVVGRNDGSVCLYGGKKMTVLVSTLVHSGGVQSIAFDATDNSFAVGAADKIISVWSLYKHE